MLKHFHYCFEPVLPTTYTDALSEGETVWKLIHQVNDLIDKINELKLYTDDQLALLNQNLRNFVQTTDIANRKWTDGQINSLRVYTDGRFTYLIDYLTKQLEELTNLINSHDGYIKAWVSVELDKFKQSFSPCPDKTTLVSPIWAKVEPIQNIIDDLWYYLRYGGITAYEYDVANISAQDYDDVGLTAMEYDLLARWKILKRSLNNYKFKMFSPYTGELISYKRLIEKLFEYHRVDTLTVEEYDNLNLSADNYNQYNITAYDYDWNGKTILSNPLPPAPPESDPGFVNPYPNIMLNDDEMEENNYGPY